MDLERLKVKLLDRISIIDGKLETPCWEWQGSRVSGGYGNMTFEHQSLYTHRASWIVYKGPVPDGFRVLHKCDNRPCINPQHLFIGTQEDNIRDMIEKGRRNRNAFLTEDEVHEIRILLSEGDLSQYEIGEMYNVSRSSIQQIKLGNNWSHVV